LNRRLTKREFKLTADGSANRFDVLGSTVATYLQLITQFGVGGPLGRLFLFKFIDGLSLLPGFRRNLSDLVRLCRIARRRCGPGIFRGGRVEAVPGNWTAGRRHAAATPRAAATGKHETKKKCTTSRFHVTPLKTRERTPAHGEPMCEPKCTQSGFLFAPPTPNPNGSRRRGRGCSLIKAIRNHQMASAGACRRRARCEQRFGLALILLFR